MLIGFVVKLRLCAIGSSTEFSISLQFLVASDFQCEVAYGVLANSWPLMHAAPAGRNGRSRPAICWVQGQTIANVHAPRLSHAPGTSTSGAEL
jgi:hypothetical protein